MGYQEETGRIKVGSRWNARCCVIAEGWPSWSFALHAFGARNVTTLLPSATKQAVLEIKETAVGSSLMEFEEWKSELESQSNFCDVVFIQGSDYFVSEMRGKVEENKDLAIVGIVPDDGTIKRHGSLVEKTWLDSKSMVINHQQAGGVTRGRWRVFSNLRLTGLKSSPVKRVLQHILVSTESGMTFDEDDRTCKLIRANQRIPSRKRHVRVGVPSCFAKSSNSLVERDLSDKEMMSAYDIEESVQRALTGYVKHTGMKLTRDFVNEAPVKVLYLVTQLVIKARHDEDKTSERNNLVHSFDIETSTARNSKGTVKRPRIEELGLEVQGDSQTEGKELPVSKRPRVIPEQASEVPSQVATKNDDAPVQVTDWDVWTVNNYQHPETLTVRAGKKGATGFQIKNPAKVLVCKPGTYSPATHGRLFDALRALLLRRARRNALRGLLSYLRKEYGTKKVNESVRYPEKKEKTKPRRKRKRKRKRGKATRGNSTKDVESSSKGLMCKNTGIQIAFGPSLGREYQVSDWTHRRRMPSEPRSQRLKGSLDPCHELYQDCKVGRDAMRRLANSSWWGWDDGSTLFFWRWPKRHRRAVRDGTKLFVKKEKLPHYFKRQLWPSDTVHRMKMETKIGKVRERGYIQPGEVNSLTGFFAVPKGDEDIRIVYDATACGLNDALWAPNFALPTIDSVLRNASQESWFSDIDLGEMFLNYFLDEEMREFAGVDVREIGGARWERWERTLMGFRPSPYVCTQTFGWGEDLIRGDRRCPNNPLRWDSVKTNLPGDPDYNPRMPWIYRWDDINMRMASDFCCYIDDIRGIGNSERVCRAATRRVASWVNYLGQQDAPRKRRPPSKKPGAWAGAMCLAREDGLYVTCSQKKWEKAQAIVKHWFDEVVVGKNQEVNAAQMERDVGFLVHLSRTFPSVFPYLKGFYLTLNTWRKGRNDEGWKFTMNEWRAALDMDDDIPSYKVEAAAKQGRRYQLYSDRPVMVKTVPRLAPDLLALVELFSGKGPAQRLVRGNRIQTARFAFGDASGGGFGSSWEATGGNKEVDEVAYRFGTWDEVSSAQSSNYRELRNLTETLELMSQKGELQGTELFMFTDNSTAESAFAKGSSSSKLLFELILRLRNLEMRGSCKIHVVHVAGTRMIAQGSDGLSRGNLSEGVMRGVQMKDFVPINKDAFERSPKLKEWLNDWTEQQCAFLDAAGWFTTGQELDEGLWEENADGFRIPTTRPGTFVWSPPPIAAGIAMEELRRSRHKSFESTHVVVIPRLCSTEWRKQLHKAADVVLSLPVGHPAWPADMHEPLTLAILFPYLSHRPWELRRSPRLMELANTVRKVWESDPLSERPVLRQLWNLQRELSSMSESMASTMLYGK